MADGGGVIRELKYEGLIIKLFSPKDNGETFYIIGIKTTVGDYKSARGIKVGDRSEQLKIKYPGISVVKDGRTDSDNCAYQFTKDNQNYIIFEVKNAKITEINIYHEAP